MKDLQTALSCPFADCTYKATELRRLRPHLQHKHQLQSNQYHLDQHGAVLLECQPLPQEAAASCSFSPATQERLQAHASHANQHLCQLCLGQGKPVVTLIKDNLEAIRQHRHRKHAQPALSAHSRKIQKPLSAVDQGPGKSESNVKSDSLNRRKQRKHPIKAVPAKKLCEPADHSPSSAPGSSRASKGGTDLSQYCVDPRVPLQQLPPPQVTIQIAGSKNAQHQDNDDPDLSGTDTEDATRLPIQQSFRWKKGQKLTVDPMPSRHPLQLEHRKHPVKGYDVDLTELRLFNMLESDPNTVTIRLTRDRQHDYSLKLTQNLRKLKRLNQGCIVYNAHLCSAQWWIEEGFRNFMQVPYKLISSSKLAQDNRLEPFLLIKRLQMSLKQWQGFNKYEGRINFIDTPPEQSIVKIPPPTYRCRSQSHEMQVLKNTPYWDPVKKACSVKYLTCHFKARLFAEGHSTKQDAIQRCGRQIICNEWYLTCVGCQVQQEFEGHKFKRPLVICKEHMLYFHTYYTRPRKRRPQLAEVIRHQADLAAAAKKKEPYKQPAHKFGANPDYELDKNKIRHRANAKARNANLADYAQTGKYIRISKWQFLEKRLPLRPLPLLFAEHNQSIKIPEKLTQDPAFSRQQRLQRDIAKVTAKFGKKVLNNNLTYAPTSARDFQGHLVPIRFDKAFMAVMHKLHGIEQSEFESPFNKPNRTIYDYRKCDISTWSASEGFDETTKALYDDDPLTHLLIGKRVANELAEVFILDKDTTGQQRCCFKIIPDDPNVFCYVQLQRTGAWKFQYFNSLRFKPGDFFGEHARRLLNRQNDILDHLGDGRVNNKKNLLAAHVAELCATSQRLQKKPIYDHYRNLIVGDFRSCHPQLLPQTREQKLKLQIRHDNRTFTVDLEYQPRKAKAVALGRLKPKDPQLIEHERHSHKLQLFETRANMYRRRVDPLLESARALKNMQIEYREEFCFDPALLGPVEQALCRLLNHKKFTGKDINTCLNLLGFLRWFTEWKMQLARFKKYLLLYLLPADITVKQQYHLLHRKTLPRMVLKILGFSVMEQMARTVQLGNQELRGCSAFEMLRIEQEIHLLCGCFPDVFHELWELLNEKLELRGLPLISCNTDRDAQQKACYKENCPVPAYLQCQCCKKSLCVNHAEHLNRQLEDGVGFLEGIDCYDCTKKVVLDYELADILNVSSKEISVMEPSGNIEAEEFSKQPVEKKGEYLTELSLAVPMSEANTVAPQLQSRLEAAPNEAPITRAACTEEQLIVGDSKIPYEKPINILIQKTVSEAPTELTAAASIMPPFTDKKFSQKDLHTKKLEQLGEDPDADMVQAEGGEAEASQPHEPQPNQPDQPDQPDLTDTTTYRTKRNQLKHAQWIHSMWRTDPGGQSKVTWKELFQNLFPKLRLRREQSQPASNDQDDFFRQHLEQDPGLAEDPCFRALMDVYHSPPLSTSKEREKELSSLLSTPWGKVKVQQVAGVGAAASKQANEKGYFTTDEVVQIGKQAMIDALKDSAPDSESTTWAKSCMPPLSERDQSILNQQVTETVRWCELYQKELNEASKQTRKTCLFIEDECPHDQCRFARACPDLQHQKSTVSEDARIPKPKHLLSKKLGLAKRLCKNRLSNGKTRVTSFYTLRDAKASRQFRETEADQSQSVLHRYFPTDPAKKFKGIEPPPAAKPARQTTLDTLLNIKVKQ